MISPYNVYCPYTTNLADCEDDWYPSHPLWIRDNLSSHNSELGRLIFPECYSPVYSWAVYETWDLPPPRPPNELWVLLCLGEADGSPRVIRWQRDMLGSVMRVASPAWLSFAFLDLELYPPAH